MLQAWAWATKIIVFCMIIVWTAALIGAQVLSVIFRGHGLLF